MAKKLLSTDFNLILELEHVKRFGKPLEGDEQAKVNLRVLEEVQALIERHVLPHSPVGIQILRKAIPDYRCSYCNSGWTEASSDYNGGCCAGDEKHNPNPDIEIAS
jgi:hypothetical protein